MFIPINKPLAPTVNLERVKGKRFNAVDVRETVGEPISEQEVSRVKTGVQEIVYEVEDESRKSFNIYTSRTSIPERRPIFGYEIPQRQSFFRPEVPFRQSTVIRESQLPRQPMVRVETVRGEARAP